MSAAEIQDILADAPSSQVPKQAFGTGGISLVDLLEMTGLTKSKSDARRLIEGGGIYVNNVRADDVSGKVALAEGIEGRFLVLRKGKKSYHLVQVVQ